MTTNNTNNDNINDDEVPDPVMVECFLTEEEYPEDEMDLIPLNRHGFFLLERHNRAVRIAQRDGTPIPVLEDYIRDNNIRMVHVHADVPRTYCDDCGALFNMDDDDVIAGEGVEACSSCSRRWNWCDIHDRYWNNDEGECEYCYDERESEDDCGRWVHDYSYRPFPLFHTILKDGTPLVSEREPSLSAVTGFELEMEAVECDRESAAERAARLFADITYLKHDGSLNNGFEMVSHPMSLEYINNTLPLESLRELANMGMRSAKTNTCGLHIHINKSFFRQAPTTLYRFMTLFYANSEQWQRLAGRSASSYARWDLSEGQRMLAYVRALASGDRYVVNEDRYVAINLQPSKTVEMRFFKGTMNPDTVKARLQSIHAVAEYAMESRFTTSITKHSNWDAFRVWTSARDDRFSAFNTYANNKGV